MTKHRLLTLVGSRVRKLRKARGWTRRKLGEASNVSERYLTEIESGRGNPSILSLAAVADALETTPSALLAQESGVIALLGLRGAGKSTVGPALAKRLRVPFIELDEWVEKAAGLSLREIFELHGEAYYRRLERESLERVLSSVPRAVLATGGGLVTDERSFAMLRERAVTIWLRARPEVHWERVLAQGDQRPMANDPGAMERLRALWTEREALYRTAHHCVDVSDAGPRHVVRSLEKALTARA